MFHTHPSLAASRLPGLLTVQTLQRETERQAPAPPRLGARLAPEHRERAAVSGVRAATRFNS